MSAPGPVVHRTLCGQLKHHYLLEDGSLAYQKKPLESGSRKRRLGYQLLLDESTGTVFVDLYQMPETERPRLQLFPAFLALAWTAPRMGRHASGPTGLPDVLVVPAKTMDVPTRDLLVSLSEVLRIRLVHPESGADAAVHLVSRINSALESAYWEAGDLKLDWTRPGALLVLSHTVARRVFVYTGATAPYRGAAMVEAMRTGVLPAPAPARRLPDALFDKFASLYGKSREEFLELCGPYFLPDRSPPLEARD